MATSFALDHLGAKFEVKITDCNNGANFDHTTIIEQSIVFTKPNGTKFEKPATLENDPENPPLDATIQSIIGTGFDEKVTVTLAVGDADFFTVGDLITIVGSGLYDAVNRPVIEIIGNTTVIYDLGAISDNIGQDSGTIVTQQEKLVTYINGADGTPAETESILDLIGNWEYAGKVRLTNNDEFQTSERFVFWVK